MNLLSSFKLAVSSLLGAALFGCASHVDTATPAVVRTAPPQNYEKTITNYLAFKIREPQKDAELSFGVPEPSACALDAYLSASRGWVVPVVYVTRAGAPSGKDAIRINAKQYYFWFLNSTLAGVTPRIDLCPGVGASFESPPANPTADGLMTTGLPVSASGEPQRRSEVGLTGASKQSAAREDATAASSQAPKATSSAKKTATSSGKSRPPVKKKTGKSSSKPKPT